MPQIAAFHDVRFPTAIALGSTGGPERRTEIVTLGSGREQRNQRWSRSRRRLWFKGEESGHVQKVREIRVDCDADVVLL